MEQKRTLWVVAASGVFLLVVVGAAVILYSPSVSKSQAAQAAVNPNNGWTTPVTGTVSSPLAAQAPVNPFENTAFPSDAGYSAQPEQPASAPSAVSKNPIQTNSVTVIADNTTVYGTGTTTIDLNALKTTVSPNVTAQNATTQAQIAQTQSVYDQRSVTEPTYNYESEPVATAPKAVASTKAPATTAASKPAATAATAKAPATTKAAPKTASSTKVATQTNKIADKFWVQAASYASKKSADDARETLESNKIPSEVFTYTDAKGKVFYRVRVGPYTTSSEAEYWKTQVAKIDRFADSQSYIVNSSAKAVK